MTPDRFKKILREEIDRVVSEQTAPVNAASPLSAMNDRLFVAGKPTRIDIETFVKDYKDVKVKKLVMNSDGTPTLTLSSGDLTKDVHYKNAEKVKQLVTTIQRGGIFKDEGTIGSFIVAPIAT